MFVSIKKLTILLITLLLLGHGVRAEENEEEKQKIYSSSTSLSLLYTSGNSQELTLGFDTEQNFRHEKNLIQFKGSVIYSESDGSKKSELFYSHIEYKRDVTSRVYILGFGQAEKNELAGYKYRIALSAGGGYFWIKSEKLTLSSEGALGWNIERNIEKAKNGVNSFSFASLMVSNKLQTDITSTTEFVEHLILIFNLKTSEDYRISSMTSLSVNISKYLALKLSHQLKYNHDPVPGFKSTDNYFLSSLVLNF